MPFVYIDVYYKQMNTHVVLRYNTQCVQYPAFAASLDVVVRFWPISHAGTFYEWMMKELLLDPQLFALNDKHPVSILIIEPVFQSLGHSFS